MPAFTLRDYTVASRPEQTFFADPALDRALAMIMTLGAELYVTRDHVHVLEALLVSKGVLEPDEVERYAPDPAAAEARSADRDAFVHALMANVQGHQVSKGVA